MTLEPDELEIRKRIANIERVERHTYNTKKAPLKMKIQNELNSLRDKRASDPLLTIQLRESTIQKLRNITPNGISGFNPDRTYNMIVNHILSTAEIKEQ